MLVLIGMVIGTVDAESRFWVVNMHAEELEAEVKDVDVDVIARECDSANSEFGEQLGRAPQPHTITLQPYIWCFWFSRIANHGLVST